MDTIESVTKLQKDTELAMAMEQPAAGIILDRMAQTLADGVMDLLGNESLTTDRLLDVVLSARGLMKALRDMGYDVKKVIDLATRKAVERQVEVLKLPQRRRMQHEGSPEGETGHG